MPTVRVFPSRTRATPDDAWAFVGEPPLWLRYFPDRPVLIPPAPDNHNGYREPGFRAFYDRLEREEPDRLVMAPSGGMR